MTRHQQYQAECLKAYFGQFETIAPGSNFHDRITSVLDRANDEALRAVANADIRFVSTIARQHLRARTNATQKGFRHAAYA